MELQTDLYLGDSKKAHIYDIMLKGMSIMIAALLIRFVPNQWIIVITSFIAIAAILYLSLRTVATWFYCRFTLEMKITLSQAKKLNRAFTPIFPWQKWMPM